MLIPNPDIYFWNFYPKIHFWANLSPKIQSCPFCLKIGTHSISRMLIPNPDLDFWNFDPKIHSWANLGPKSQRCPFCLKIKTHGISSMLILIPILVFWISNPNFLFGQIWPKKVKVVRFTWTLVHMVSYLEVSDSYSNINFLNFKTQIHFWANLDRKIQSCPVWLKIGTQSVSTMLILIPTFLFSVSNPKSFSGQIWAEKFKVVHFDWKLAHMVYRGCWFLFRQ